MILLLVLGTPAYLGYQPGHGSEALVLKRGADVQVVRQWKSDGDRVWFVVSPDGRHVVLAEQDGHVLTVRRLSDGIETKVWADKESRAGAVAWTSDSSFGFSSTREAPRRAEEEPRLVITAWTGQLGGSARQIGSAKDWGDYSTRYQKWDRAAAKVAAPPSAWTNAALSLSLPIVIPGSRGLIPFPSVKSTVYLWDGQLWRYDWVSKKAHAIELPMDGEVHLHLLCAAGPRACSVTAVRNRQESPGHGLGLDHVTDSFMTRRQEEYTSFVVDLPSGKVTRVDGLVAATPVR